MAELGSGPRGDDGGDDWLKILQVFSTPFPPEEGIATYVWNLSRHLRRRGHEVTLLTRGGRSPRTETVEGIKIHHSRFWSVHPFHVHLQRLFLGGFFRQHPAGKYVYHLHSPYPAWPPRGFPYLLTVHTPMIPDSASIKERSPYALAQKAQSRFLRIREGRMFRRARAIATVSAAVADEVRNYGVPAERIAVLGNAVDCDQVRPAASPRRDFLLYAGRLGPRKGLDDLMDALEMLARKERRPTVIVTGRGPLQESLASRIRASDLSSSVAFRGVVPRATLLDLIAHARSVVIPSHYEGLPTVLLEAMASGTPVVATDIPGIRESVPPEVRRDLVPPGSPQRLAEKIDAVLAQPRESVDRMGTLLRTHAMRNYSWEALAERYERFYLERGA